MKTIAKKIMVAFITGAAILSGCEKDTYAPVTSGKSIGKSDRSDFIEMKWKLLHFTDLDGDHAEKFKNYLFVFHKSGILEVTNGEDVNYQGKWSNGTMDHKANFLITFEQNSPLTMLNGQWTLDNKEDHTLILKMNSLLDKNSNRLLVFDEFLSI